MRLTRKFGTNYYFNTDHRDIVEKDIEDDSYAAQSMRNKLGQLEDIEEELRIDLVTLFKALRRGAIWVREHNTEDKEIVFEEITFDFNDHSLWFRYPRAEIGKARNLFDYGITWALTKEELE